MASCTMSVGTHDIDFLKDTLHAQQELLQKLYNELDVERESSSTAADEALSMILRLQGEKAAMEMEASQYKRIAEEKMCHAQETLEIFQELIYQKEMQIASLEFQVQAYKFKLVSLGCDDLGACELQYPENMLSKKNGVSGEASSRSSLRRGSSVPPPPMEAMSKRASSDGTKSSHCSPKMLGEIKDSEPFTKRGHNSAVDPNSYYEEIRKLDERVKELATIKDFNGILYPETSNGVSGFSSSSPMRDPSPENTPVKVDINEDPEKTLTAQACGSSSCSTSVQDIFEVPICCDDNGSQRKEKRKLTTSEDESKYRQMESVWEEIWKSDVKEKIDWEKKPLLSPGINDDSPKPADVKEKPEWEKKPPLLSPGCKLELPKVKDGKMGERERPMLLKHPTCGVADFEEKIDWEKKPLLSPGCKNEVPKPKDGKSGERQMLLKHPTYAVADFELQQFNRRLKQLEDERFLTRGHEVNMESGDEKLRLLKEIKEKIDSLRAEITDWKPKNSPPPPPEDRPVGCLKEVMLCFLP